VLTNNLILLYLRFCQRSWWSSSLLGCYALATLRYSMCRSSAVPSSSWTAWS